MMRVLIAPLALALCALPLFNAPVTAIAVIGLIAVGLVTLGIAILWPWFITAAACVFLVEYAAALWLAAGPVNILVALGFGIALFLLLQVGAMARRVRQATVGAAVISSQISRWIGFVGGVFATAILAMALAGGLAAAIPLVAAPWLAAGGALGAVLALAVLIRAARANSSGYLGAPGAPQAPRLGGAPAQPWRPSTP